MSQQPELSRLGVLAEYQASAPLDDAGFDSIVHLASTVFNVPIALVSLVEATRQVFAARIGLDACETSREVSFCAHAIKAAEVMVVPDAAQDARFANNPLVTDAPHIRFYAGAPLRSSDGETLGTLCIIDSKPREIFTDGERAALADMAVLVMEKLEHRRLSLLGRSSQVRFEQIAASSPDGIICADESGKITFWNGAATRLLGYQASEVLGRDVDLIAPDLIRSRIQEISAASEAPVSGSVIELPAKRKDGTMVAIELSTSVWRESERYHFGAILRDVTERKAHEARLRCLAHLDPLTGLPNRSMLKERIEHSLQAARPAGLILIDLDGFKGVNDTLGHSAGDSVLQLVAERVQRCVGPLNTVARMGGDEFAVLVVNTGDPLALGETADQIIAAISSISEIDNSPIHISASIGIALSPAHGASAEELTSGADMALYLAKRDGRHCRRFFTPALRQAAQRKQTYQNELRRARETGEFELFYQPQVRLSDGALMGAEALIRWRHPDAGIVAPAAFLPALEKSRFAAEIGEWVLKSACQQAARWRAAGREDFKIGVNLFAAQLRHKNFAETVFAALSQAGLPTAALELEITENIFLQRDAQAVEPLRTLQRAGVSIAFDDYGTGYASLSMLKGYPLSRLKIDQSFVRNMSTSTEDAAIIRAILFLGRSFGLDVIAEGVETPDQARRLLQKGCEEAQGYLFGKPMSAGDFDALFSSQEPSADRSCMSIAKLA